MSTLRNVLVVCLSFAAAGSLYAQSGTATITGTVTDPSGAALPGVRIVARDAATGFERQTRTNQDGAYSLPGLRPATYDVTAELAGFRAYSRKGFRVEVSQVARLNIGLELGQVTETLEVAGQLQLLTESASLGAVIDERKILELPLNGRDFVQLALLVPGVNTGQPGAGRGGGISIGGTRSEQNSFQLDGVSNTDQYDSGISFRPSVDAVAEFKIEVNNYSAEFGKGAGGQIIGETDEIGLKAINRQAHVHDIHATILQLLGLHHRETTYFHNGRDERPTINGGIPLREIVG